MAELKRDYGGKWAFTPGLTPLRASDIVAGMQPNKPLIAVVGLSVLAAMALVIVIASSALAQTGPDPSFAAFWQGFQDAVRTKANAKLAAMAKYPLPVHGEIDTARVLRLNQSQTLARLSKWLAQDSGMSEKLEPMRDVILRTDAAAIVARGPNRGVTERSVRFGSFLFERDGDRWRLTRVYEER